MKLKIVIISDTHNKHNEIESEELPAADVIIHCGDFTSMGYGYEITDFMKWYSNLNQYDYKLIIAGNHDLMFENASVLAKAHIPENVIYLEDSGVEILGVNFYGTPVQKEFMNWAFNRPEEKLKEHWMAIPDNTDVLITHSPPYRVRDFGFYSKDDIGSPSLYDEVVNRIKPKIHAFGHAHTNHGITEINRIKFINASNLNDKYEYRYKPIVIELEI
jgi:Icc-related predicted phosphoesterase